MKAAAVRVRAALGRAAAAARRACRGVWARDRAALHGWAAAWTRLARVATWSVRGVFVHRLSLQAAALAYYTLFSIVPVLVVALWVLKLAHLIPELEPELPAATGAEAHFPDANQFLRLAAHAILAAVDRAGRLEAGVVGLAALLYGVIRQVIHVEVALDTIAGARRRRPTYRRMLGYLALLVLPPALVIVSGLLRTLAGMAFAAPLARAASWLLAHAPLLRSALGAVVGLSVLCLALAIFYASAARARIAFPSAVVGGALGALSLAVVMWVFARLQIGAARAGALESGMAAVPVFLLWSFFSWLVVLIGAEVAVAHELDRTLIHGARLRLEPYDERAAGVELMVDAARRARAGGGAAGATVNELARGLRLLPENVRALVARLLDAKLLRESPDGRLQLACEPARPCLRAVGAVLGGRPDGGPGGKRRRARPTLADLADRSANRETAPLSDGPAVANWTV